MAGVDDLIKNNAMNSTPGEMPDQLKSLINKVLGYASSPIAGARGITANQGHALNNAAGIVGGVYGDQLKNQSAGMSNLLAMRGQDITQQDAANTLDWAKKSNPLVSGDEASKAVGGKGVGGKSGGNTPGGLDWSSFGKEHLDYLNKNFGVHF